VGRGGFFFNGDRWPGLGKGEDRTLWRHGHTRHKPERGKRKPNLRLSFVFCCAKGVGGQTKSEGKKGEGGLPPTRKSNPKPQEMSLTSPTRQLRNGEGRGKKKM